ncbi:MULTISPECIES: hypothetical protein [Bacillus]|uniref:hypothetical protein n=1 Tax=Bacillus TaxID=1386 RepID=UPI0022AABF1A|nr:hypothetical protein [Bacillus safensis]MCZ2737536.1 hypothetical protein [Bacillus safensis]
MLHLGQYLSFEEKLALLQDYERQLRIRYETYVAIEQNIQELYQMKRMRSIGCLL